VYDAVYRSKPTELKSDQNMKIEEENITMLSANSSQMQANAKIKTKI
jgi:hypothetical protein